MSDQFELKPETIQAHQTPHVCRTCRWVRWVRGHTPTGRVGKYTRGYCDYPMPELPNGIEISWGNVYRPESPAWSNAGAGCEFWEQGQITK